MSGNIELRGMKSIEPKIGEYGLRAESARSVQKTFFSFLFFIALLFFSACAIKTAKFTTSELRSNSAQTKLLILEPHVAIHEVSMGGAIEPKADWTEAGTKNIIQALKDTLRSHKGEHALNFEIYELQDEIKLKLSSRKQKIKINSELLSELEAHEILYKLN